MRKIDSHYAGGALSIDSSDLPPIVIDPIVDPVKPEPIIELTLTARKDGTFATTDAWGLTTVYADDAGSELLGYETNYGWGDFQYFSSYNANWEIQQSVNTEGSRTTEYAMVDGVLTLISLSVDYSDMTATVEDGYTLYAEVDDYGNTVTYYKVTETDTLSHYTVAYQNSYTYNDWWTGEEITSEYSGTTFYDAEGNITSVSSSYQYGTYVSSDAWEYQYDEAGKLTSITSTYSWKDGKTSSTSSSSYDGNWQSLSSTVTTSTVYTDDAGVEQVSEETVTTEYEYDDAGAGALVAYLLTTINDKGTQEERVDVADMVKPYPCYEGDDVCLVDDKVGYDATIVTKTGLLTPPFEQDYVSGSVVSDAVITSLTDDLGHTHKVYLASDEDNVLSGTDGGDKLFGKAGNDIYHVNHKEDRIYESSGFTDTVDLGGEDSVESTISYTLDNFVENLYLMGDNAINATGNTLDNELKGNTAKNNLKGGNGNDWLHGGLGKDKLTGGGGADAFVFDTTLGKNNVDTITDFATKKDKIVLDNSIFTALSETGLTKSELLVSKTATKAKTADQHLIYNTNKGELYYDADGKGGESAIKIAIIGTTEHPTTLSVDHFSVIGG